jgi:excisionase family DNA binding protein
LNRLEGLMAELPDVFTVEEAAQLLRIGRTAAYQLARRYELTDGAEGMPAKRVGRQLRVPRDLLEAWVGTTLHSAAPKPAVVVELTDARTPTTEPRSANRRPRKPRPESGTLPFPA